MFESIRRWVQEWSGYDGDDVHGGDGTVCGEYQTRPDFLRLCGESVEGTHGGVQVRLCVAAEKVVPNEVMSLSATWQNLFVFSLINTIQNVFHSALNIAILLRHAKHDERFEQTGLI